MVGGHATMNVSFERIDLTPPQLFVGHEIKAVSFQGKSVKSFTVPFKVEGNGMVFLVLAIHE
jgi:CheY-specific phosphatase CheX